MTTITDDLRQAVQQHQQAATFYQTEGESIESRIDTKIAEMDAWKGTTEGDLQEKMHTNSPITPNLIADTYQFASLCGGQTNTPMDIIDAHNGSLFAASYYGTPNASVTVEVVTLDQLDAKGIGYGGDLSLATNSTFDGSEFRVLLFHAEVNTDTSNWENHGAYIQFLKQNQSELQSGWYKGETATQAQVLVNVIEHSGDIIFKPHDNIGAEINIDGDKVGQGWTFHHSTIHGFNGFNSPSFRHTGTMTVAIALPYLGYGDNGGKFFWADSIRQAKNGRFRYSHFMGND